MVESGLWYRKREYKKIKERDIKMMVEIRDR